ncbi:MAG: transcription-repair coupling factor [Elusimicrobia bacterium]|nr:transcription-repair coupling factor [Elusimicrobiota bacterium]
MLNSFELSGGLAYSVIKNNSSKQFIIPMKNDEDAADISESILTLSKILKHPVPPVKVFPESDVLYRIKSISEILKSKNGKICLCTSVPALNKKTFSPKNFEKSVINVKKNKKINRDSLVLQLSEMGYIRTDITMDVSEFSVRGEILDIWNTNSELPVRIVFNIDTVEAVKNIDPSSQRSISEIESAEIIPAEEKEEVRIFDYFQNGYTFTENDIVPYLPVPEFNGNIDFFKQKISQWQDEDFRIFIIANNEGEKKHLSEILNPDGTYEELIFTGNLYSGFICNKDKNIFITTNEIFSRYKLRQRLPKFRSYVKLSEPLEDITDMRNGDFVVHEKYGIGIYDGLKKITAGGITAEYISISYANNDKLFVPVNDFSRIQRYFGVGKGSPRINSLDSIAWEKTRAVADENAKILAQQLLESYTERYNIRRPQFVPFSDYEKEFEDEFIYEETSDQKKAIDDTIKDMLSPYPMERCIFGDTGFGKTEVAMRAALKSVLSGRQVCLMAPTTVLVQQHEQTFLDRFADWPVKIATLSRFKTKKEQKEIIEKLKNGKIDIVIGTHRLLSKDIVFNNPGLLIIDEEHRFGVADKEKIKMLKKNIDCLYLTATPIPRTLSMSLSGIKNMSSIETAPAGRQSVETVLLEHNEKIAIEAIMYEISRGGQIFYIHNKIGTIENCIERLKKTLPLVKFDFLHGRMPAHVIEEKMMRFLKKEFDCLVSTTIIEAGLDIPNVNTIIVEDAGDFGLSQLYQLRGRVGRSKIKAHCYLFYKKEKLNDIAEKRLAAIKEFTKLGSGFRLALKDLQIRGAGEILGKRQHGYIDSIGFDMYLKLLEKNSNELKGIKNKEEINPEMDISIDAIIPSRYINDEIVRIGFYKRILTAVNPEDIEEIRMEIRDRFGKIPDETENLFEISRVRLLAKKIGIIKVSSSPSSVLMNFSMDTAIEPSKILSVLSASGGKDKNFRFVKSDLLEVFFENSPRGGEHGRLSQKEIISTIKNMLQSFM